MLSGGRLFHATPLGIAGAPCPVVSRCVLIRSNFTWPCQLPSAPARSLVRFPLPSPIAISNHSIAHLMKNTLNKREGEKDGDGEQKREGEEIDFDTANRSR